MEVALAGGLRGEQRRVPLGEPGEVVVSPIRHPPREVRAIVALEAQQRVRVVRVEALKLARLATLAASLRTAAPLLRRRVSL
ncbi:hypothetical protein [Micromonospora haikouensis]|uniref:hypothetical protein n=1 Tax=Micromonospora haikouensis TaxID=686309 RepID=UPI00210935D8|nr:hypothetical protein [Micromonospora haikouensis]